MLIKHKCYTLEFNSVHIYSIKLIEDNKTKVLYTSSSYSNRIIRNTRWQVKNIDKLK